MQTHGNGLHPMDSERLTKELRLIAEFWNEFDLNDEIDVAIRELLEPLKQKVTEALYAKPPDIILARRLTSTARRILEDSGGS